MIFVSILYFVFLLTLLFYIRFVRMAPFLIANSFFIILTLPSAAAYFYLFISPSGVSYAKYMLNPNLYLVMITTSIVTLFLQIFFYRRGLTNGFRAKAATTLFVKTTTLSFFFPTFCVIFMALGIIVYLHAAFGFAYILEPRRLYELSRDGYTLHYFLLGFFLRLSVLLLLFARFRYRAILIICIFIFRKIFSNC